MNLVFSILGTGPMTTSKRQLAFRDSASTASHVTVVAPIGNSLPDGGVQVTTTGACPSCASGVSKVTVGS